MCDRSSVFVPDTGRWQVAGPLELTSTAGDRKWQDADAIRGFVEFNHSFRPDASNKNSPTLIDVAAEARCVLESPIATTAKLIVAWDDRLTLRVNDDEPRDLGEQAYLIGRTIEVPLVKGANRIQVRLSNTTGLTRGAWNFSFSARTADGKTLIPQRDSQ